jgi:hypothetical protein
MSTKTDSKGEHDEAKGGNLSTDRKSAAEKPPLEKPVNDAKDVNKTAPPPPPRDTAQQTRQR